MKAYAWYQRNSRPRHSLTIPLMGRPVFESRRIPPWSKKGAGRSFCGTVKLHKNALHIEQVAFQSV